VLRIAEYLMILAIQTVLISVVWRTGQVAPESSWIGWPEIALVLATPNIGALFLLWHAARPKMAAVVTVVALAAGGTGQVWHQWDKLNYDRTSLDAVAQSSLYLLSTTTVGVFGFLVLLVVVSLQHGSARRGSAK
jgi:hypothetical protein